MILKLGMKHQGEKLYKVYINHGDVITLEKTFMILKKMDPMCWSAPTPGHVHVYGHVRGMAEKFVDTIGIFNRKRNSVKMNISGLAKIFHDQIDEIL